MCSFGNFGCSNRMSSSQRGWVLSDRICETFCSLKRRKRMMFFQFRHVCKGFLLCRRRLFAGKRSGEENLCRVWMDSNRSKTACPMFCRIACWSDIALVVCGLGFWGTWLRNCPCCRMSAAETLRMRIIASPLLLMSTHNSYWRHCKSCHYSPSPSPSSDNSHIKMKKFIAYVILFQHQLAAWPKSFTVSWPYVSHASYHQMKYVKSKCVMPFDSRLIM